MFISVKRHEREKQELISASNRLTDAILKTSSHRTVSDGFERQDPTAGLGLAGHAVSPPGFCQFDASRNSSGRWSPAKTLSVVRTYMTRLLDPARGETDAGNPLQDVEVKLPNADGSFATAHYSFEFQRVDVPLEPRSWMVRVTDITARVQQLRELEDLRVHVLTQGEILRSVLQAGGTRFGAFLQKTDASMKTINGVLKKPAREADAFRHKLEETLEEVDRIRRDAAALKLSGLQSAAREFEDSLQELRSRETLSGSDFLPLAVKLDPLYGQFALLRTLTSQAGPAREAEPAAPEARVTENGTQIIEAPKFFAELAQHASPPAQRMAAVGSLESTLTTLTDLVAQENQKTVVLECSGLDLVPPRYQATVKNVAIQLIRNAVVHGVETAAEREASRQAAACHAAPGVQIDCQDNGFELLFQDDGRGLDPDKVRGRRRSPRDC